MAVTTCFRCAVAALFVLSLPRLGAQSEQVSYAVVYAYAHKALLLEACESGGLQKMRDELAEFFGSHAAQRAALVAKQFDETYAQFLRRPDYIDRVRSGICGKPEYPQYLESHNRAIESAQTQFLKAIPSASTPQRPNANAPASSPGVGQPATAPPPEAQPKPQPPDLSNDTRLQSLPSENRDAALAEAQTMFEYCSENITLANAYDCACFTGKMVDARLAAGFEHSGQGHPPIGGRTLTPIFTVDLMVEMAGQRIDLRECVSTEKMGAYASERIGAALGRQPRYSKEALAGISACVAKALEEAARKMPALGDVNVVVTQAIVPCARTANKR